MFSSSATPLLLIANAFALALSLSFLIIILWYDIRRATYQFFALFLFMVVIWNTGYVLLQANSLMSGTFGFHAIISGLINIGYTGSSAALYALCVALIGAPLKFFRWAAFLGILLAISLNVLVVFNQAGAGFSGQASFNMFFYLLFDGVVVYILWRYRRSLQNSMFSFGCFIFVCGQGLGLVNQELGVSAASVLVGSVGCLVISFSFVRKELINPLVSRNEQLETLHEVSIAISRRIATTDLLGEIVARAAAWLGADGAVFFMKQGTHLEIAAAYQMPDCAGQKAVPGGLAKVVEAQKASLLLAHYRQDWKGADEFATISDTFGAVIATPLLYDNQVIGVLVVIASIQGRVFSRDDIRLLELLAAQAAVAIAHDRLFNARLQLTNQIQLARDQLHTVLANTNTPVIALDRDLHLMFTNKSADQLVSQVQRGESRSDFTQLVRQFAPQNLRRVLRDIRQSGAHIFELKLHEKVFLCHVARWGQPRTEGWVAVLHDVTELKELDRIKSEMVRMTSHDLKNPLQAALANIDLLKDDVDPKNYEMALSVANVERQLMKMQRIISGILDLERVKMGVHLTEMCSVADLARRAMDELYDIANDKQITLVVDMPTSGLEFMGDKSQFERAIANLIDNAIKFTPIGGTVTVRSFQHGGTIEIQIEDTGVGIPEELQDRIFDRFFRGRQAGIEHVSGSGLGLSLVKAVIESHDGTIQVKSQIGQGTVFIVRVPATKEGMPTSVK